jgi:ATP-GRASP peptide maturase of grasp-with-spasm system
LIIILTEKHDTSSNQVIEWLNYYKKKWFRINLEDKVKFEFINSEPFILCNELKISINSIKSIWYRRNSLNFHYENIYFDNQDTINLIKEEFHWYSQYIIYLLTKKKSIGNNYSIYINKLLALCKAKENGLNIPEFIITETRKNIKSNKTYITKTIAGNSIINYDELNYGNSYTKIIKKNKLPKTFTTSFFQEYVDKKYELRIFFLNNNSFSMAIFSQLDNQTKIDFRNYNKENPNRYVPYNLPKSIEKKLINTMKSLNLNSGSIDMIVSKENKFYFLEVNPIGQFGMTSVPCNYNLEKLIAEYL